MSSHNDAAHGSVKSYAVGFLLSVVLTVVPFWLVMSGGFDKWTTVITILVFAVVQIGVHLKYFLHLTLTNEEGRLNTLTFLFSALIIVLVVGLSIWIIYASNAMMMH